MTIQRIIKKEETYEVNGIKYFIFSTSRQVLTNIYCDLTKNDIGTLKLIASELDINNYLINDKMRLVEIILDSKCLVLSQDPPDPTRQYNPENPLPVLTYCPGYNYCYYHEQNKIINTKNCKQPIVNNDEDINIYNNSQNVPKPIVRNIIEEIWEDYDPKLWEK